MMKCISRFLRLLDVIATQTSSNMTRDFMVYFAASPAQAVKSTVYYTTFNEAQGYHSSEAETTALMALSFFFWLRRVDCSAGRSSTRRTKV